MLPPHVFPLVHDTDGRVLLRVQQWVAETDRSAPEIFRNRFQVVPKGGGTATPMTVLGLRNRKGPFLLKGEIWLPTGSYRIVHASEPNQGRLFTVFKDPATPLRLFCGCKTGSPSWSDLLGVFSPSGRPQASVRHTWLEPCCRGATYFRRPIARVHNARALGLLQALSRPLHVTLRDRPLTLAAGQAIVVNRDDFMPLAGEKPFPKHFKHVVVEPEVVDRFLKQTGLSHLDRKFVFDPVPRPTPPAVAAALFCLEEAMRNPQGPAARTHLDTALDQYLFALLRNFPNPILAANRDNPSVGADDPRLARAIAFLQRHYARPYDRGLLANYACVSRQRLQEIFHKHLQMDPRTYLLQVRMEKAKRLLADGQRTLAEVGKAVGYRDSRSFRRLYQRFAQAPGSGPR